MMEQDEYLQIQIMMFQIGAMIEGADFNSFLAAVDRADTMGPILDPTAWMLGHKRMHDIREMAEKLRAFQEAYQRAKGRER